jgi:glycosyltransferase involved in cell wall biosynthesis
MKPTLHLLGIPHTLSFSERYSHCAFTTKVNRFVPMMTRAGYRVVHYGNTDISTGLHGTSGGTFANVQIFSSEQLEKYTGPYDPASPKLIGSLADVNSVLYCDFNRRLAKELDSNVQPNDILCFPFGTAHWRALGESRQAGKAYWVETGIGYEETFTSFRVFESSAWMHYHYGKKKQILDDNRGSDYNWVIPNYFDLSEWKLNINPGKYVLYYGRIGEHKGMSIVKEIALRRPDLKFVVCGQGDATPFLTPNMEVRPPVHGAARSDLLGDAIVVLCPSRYVEPFGGVAVEAMLCGRPVLASVFGAFEETLPSAYCRRCRTLKDWLDGLRILSDHSPIFSKKIRMHAEKFDMHKLAKKYDAVFQQISDLTRGGWYANV